MAKKIVSALGRNSNSTSSGNDDSFKQVNVAEYTVKKKSEGKYRTKQIGYYFAFFGSIVLIIALVTAITGIFGAGAFGFMASLALSALLGVFIWQKTHQYVDIEYSYAIENAELICTEIYGNKSDKLLVQIKMSAIVETAPYEGEGKVKADAIGAEHTVNILSTPHTDQAYYCIYDKEDGTQGVVIFEGSNKTLAAFKYYSKATTVVREMRR